MPHINFFLLFILFDVFMIGFLAAIALRHGNAHLKQKKQAETAKSVQAQPIPERMSPAVKEKLMRESEAEFEATLNNSVKKLQDDLNNTSDQINNLIKKLATEVVSSEVDHYRQDLAKLREQAQKDLGSIRDQVSEHQEEIRAQVAQELEAEKQQLVKNIDTKLADAMASFLVETLQHNVDLGNQTEYLMSMLEQHKADFVKEVGVESET